ncbi:type II toxin-antitoxin system VapC family toxin [Demequina sp.]|uniref:type II toxin-antitoxin system VapC family toxin n=1 Tax=Demequina sp. TaxID=2050685 RepID=UPI003D1263D3
MTHWYLDTSAALKLLVEEAESDAFARFVTEEQPGLVASFLLETELRRAAQRQPAITQEAVSGLLAGVGMLDAPPGDFREAGLIPGQNLRSLDALHLVAAIRAGVDQLLTYDARMAGAASALGLTVHAPA